MVKSNNNCSAGQNQWWKGVSLHLMYVCWHFISNVSNEAFFCAWIVPTATVYTIASHIFPQVRITREKLPSSCSLWGDISCYIKKNILVVDQLPTRKREYMTTVDQAMVKILIPGGGGRRVAKPGPGWQSPPGGPSHGARWARRRAGEGPFCLIISLISLSLAVIWGSNVDNLYLQVDYLAARTVGRRGNGECEKAYNCPGFLMILFRFLKLIFLVS